MDYSQFFSDNANIVISGDMPIRRLMEILTTSTEWTCVDILGEEGFLTDEDLAGCEFVPVGDDEFIVLDENGEEFFEADCGADSDFVTLAALRTALEGFLASDSEALYESEDSDEDY